ncbi:unnamed protein product [Symbiodinium natans]|uniref:Uncharacterized protein n=1 Tax=Symbiodinium natans TaxID=878477 RepID=A0A812NH65_9DINO|nr:unnamed protein product [Symbiodinium natans]
MAAGTRGRAVMQLAGDVISNFFTGYYEEARPTSTEREAIRLKNELDVIRVILEHLVGPGDFFSSDERAEFAAEAFAAWGDCKGCLAAKQRGVTEGVPFAQYNRDGIDHVYVTNGPFRDIAHAIVNHQQMLDKDFFDSVVERMEEYHTKSKAAGDEYGPDEYKAMAIELATVAALCSGVRAFFAASGLPCPEFPEKPSVCQPAQFKSVMQYASGPLNTNMAIAWGPYLNASQLREDVAARADFDKTTWMFATADDAAPTSKASASPLTCMDFLRFANVMYFPVEDAARFFNVPGEDRHLTRGQLEIAAAVYTRTKSCGY